MWPFKEKGIPNETEVPRLYKVCIYNLKPKIGIKTSIKRTDGTIVDGIVYQWKRSDFTLEDFSKIMEVLNDSSFIQIKSGVVRKEFVDTIFTDEIECGKMLDNGVAKTITQEEYNNLLIQPKYRREYVNELTIFMEREEE